MFRVPSTRPPSSVDPFASTVFTPSETDEEHATEIEVPPNPPAALESSVPEAGSTYIIKHALTGKVLVFQEGEIVLGDIGGHYTYRWKCCESKGWLGFRDPASHMYLGHDRLGVLRCQAMYHRAWEEFHARHLATGGYNLLLKNWYSELHPVGLKKGEENLIRTDTWADAAVWQFIKV